MRERRRRVVIGDFDGDGYTDDVIVSTEGEQELKILWSLKDKEPFDMKIEIDESFPHDIAVGDFDRDGSDDLVMLSNSKLKIRKIGNSLVKRMMHLFDLILNIILKSLRCFSNTHSELSQMFFVPENKLDLS